MLSVAQASASTTLIQWGFQRDNGFWLSVYFYRKCFTWKTSTRKNAHWLVPRDTNKPLGGREPFRIGEVADGQKVFHSCSLSTEARKSIWAFGSTSDSLRIPWKHSSFGFCDINNFLPTLRLLPSVLPSPSSYGVQRWAAPKSSLGPPSHPVLLPQCRWSHPTALNKSQRPTIPSLPDLPPDIHRRAFNTYSMHPLEQLTGKSTMAKIELPTAPTPSPICFEGVFPVSVTHSTLAQGENLEVICHSSLYPSSSESAGSKYNIDLQSTISPHLHCSPSDPSSTSSLDYGHDLKMISLLPSVHEIYSLLST